MNEKMKKYKKGGPATSSGGGNKGTKSNPPAVKTNVNPNRVQIAAAGGIQNARANANISASYAAKAKAISAGKQVTASNKSVFSYGSGNAPVKPSSNFTYGSGNAVPNVGVKPKTTNPSGGSSSLQKNKHRKVLTTETTTESPLDPIVVNSGYTPFSTIQNQEMPSIRIPEKDNVISLTNPSADVAEITALVFEKLGAVELTKFTRTDTVEGNNPYYNIISNLSTIRKEFDPSNLVSSQKSDDSLYNAFSIKLSTKIPDENYLEEKSLNDYIFIDEVGNLIIELVNITPDELIEIEIDTNGTIVEVR